MRINYFHPTSFQAQHFQRKMDHIGRTFGIFFLNQSAMQYLRAHELITGDVAACTKLVQEQTSQNSGVNEEVILRSWEATESSWLLRDSYFSFRIWPLVGSPCFRVWLHIHAHRKDTMHSREDPGMPLEPWNHSCWIMFCVANHSILNPFL